MTNQEMIKYLLNTVERIKNAPATTKKDLDAFYMAIEVLKRDSRKCQDCMFELTKEWDMPCLKCKRNYKDYFAIKWRKEEEI